MKILKILGIAVGVHALALLLIFANPGCTQSQAADPDSPPISSVPEGTAPAPQATPPSDSSPPPTIRYSPTRPNTTVAAALEEPPVSGVTPASTYTVARGDSLWSVANKNHLTKAQLAAANKLKSNAVLKIGQKLIIPARNDQPAPTATAAASNAAPAPAQPAAAAEKSADTVKHVVRPGETLSAIAHKYGVRQGDLAVANNITDPKKIHPGQELVIPAHSSKSVKGSKSKPAATETASEAGGTQVPGGSDDLDAGLKPAQASDVPAVKVDDAGQPTPTPQKNP